MSMRTSCSTARRVRRGAISMRKGRTRSNRWRCAQYNNKRGEARGSDGAAHESKLHANS